MLLREKCYNFVQLVSFYAHEIDFSLQFYWIVLIKFYSYSKLFLLHYNLFKCQNLYYDKFENLGFLEEIRKNK